MNLGHLSKENEQFVRIYKRVGYQTKTQLINEAVELLRRKKEKEQRETLLLQEGQKYGKSKPEYAWKTIDGEEFA